MIQYTILSENLNLDPFRLHYFFQIWSFQHFKALLSNLLMLNMLLFDGIIEVERKQLWLGQK